MRVLCDVDSAAAARLPLNRIESITAERASVSPACRRCESVTSLCGARRRCCWPSCDCPDAAAADTRPEEPPNSVRVACRRWGQA